MKSKIVLILPFLGFFLSGCVWTTLHTLQQLKPGERVIGGCMVYGRGEEGHLAPNQPAEMSMFARCGIIGLGKFGRIEGGLRWSPFTFGGADLKWQVIEGNKFIPGVALIGEYFEGNYSVITEEGYPLKGSAGSIVFSKALTPSANLFTGYKYVSTRLLSSTGNRSLVESAIHNGLFMAVGFEAEKESGMNVIVGLTYLKESKVNVFPYWLEEEKESTGFGKLPQEAIIFTIAAYYPF